MSFQWIFDQATTISFDAKPIVAQSVTRSNVVKGLNRGGDSWQFSVQVPDGMKWTDVRHNLANAEVLGKVTPGDVQLNNPGYSYLTSYQGDSLVTTLFTVDYVSGSTVEISNYPSGHGLDVGDLTFKAGDIIQLAAGHCYQVTADVVYPATTMALHRPVIEDPATGIAVTIGSDVTWSVVCTHFPKHTIFGHNQVSWSGPFIFYEEL